MHYSNPYIDYPVDDFRVDLGPLDSGSMSLPPSVSRALDIVMGKDEATQKGLTKLLKKGAKTVGVKKAGRFAQSAGAQKALRVVPGLGTALTALTVLDTLSGPENIGNKGMDLAAMAGGAALGGTLIPVIGAPIGATVGKALSDGTQYLLGGGRSPEERKLEEALIALRGGGVI